MVSGNIYEQVAACPISMKMKNASATCTGIVKEGQPLINNGPISVFSLLMVYQNQDLVIILEVCNRHTMTKGICMLFSGQLTSRY